MKINVAMNTPVSSASSGSFALGGVDFSFLAKKVLLWHFLIASVREKLTWNVQADAISYQTKPKDQIGLDCRFVTAGDVSQRVGCVAWVNKICRTI